MGINILSLHVQRCKEILTARNVCRASTITSTQIAQRQRSLDFSTIPKQLQFLFQSNQVGRQVLMPFQVLALFINADLEQLK